MNPENGADPMPPPVSPSPSVADAGAILASPSPNLSNKKSTSDASSQSVGSQVVLILAAVSFVLV
jgi:hypothetical protein